MICSFCFLLQIAHGITLLLGYILFFAWLVKEKPDGKGSHDPLDNIPLAKVSDVLPSFDKVCLIPVIFKCQLYLRL